MATQPEANVASLNLVMCDCGEEFVGELFLAVHQRQMKHGLHHPPCIQCKRRRPEVKFRSDRQVCLSCIRVVVTADPREEYEGRDGMTLKEVAEVLNLSTERVRQIEQSAIRKLRNNAKVMSAVRKLLEGRS